MKTIKIILTKEEAKRFNLLKSRIGLDGKKLTPEQNGELVYLIRGILADMERIKSVQICKREFLCMKFEDNTYYRFANIL